MDIFVCPAPANIERLKQALHSVWDDPDIEQITAEDLAGEYPTVRYVPPDEFSSYEKVAYTKGFLMVSASPLTRSSHHAGDDFAKLKAARAATAR